MSIKKRITELFLRHLVKGRSGGRDIRDIRRDLDARADKAKLPSGVSIDETEIAGVPGEWVRRDGGSPEATVLYVHGGGHSNFSPKAARGITTQLARLCHVDVFAVGYRLAPEHPFPADVRDCAAVYEALIGEGGLRPEEIAFYGDSSGGGTMLATALDLKSRNVPLPTALVGVSPWVDKTLESPSLHVNERREWMITPGELIWMRQMYLQGHDPRDPLASPILGDLVGLPPVLLHVAESEILRDDALRLADRLREAGVPTELVVREDVPHVWHAMAGMIPEAATDLRAVGRFIASRTQKRADAAASHEAAEE